MSDDTSTMRVVSTSGSDIGPGERLREAREAAQLTVGEVASRLRLTTAVVERLERDDYERLHGATFVRGYLSSYARLLDLPEGPILEAYERAGHGPPALVSDIGRKPEVHVSDFPVRMVTYVIAGLLVVLVVLWWQSRQLGPDIPERVDAGPSSTAEPAAGSAAEMPPSLSAGAAFSDAASDAVSAPAPQSEAQTAAAGGDREAASAESPQPDDAATVAREDATASDPQPSAEPADSSAVEAPALVAETATPSTDEVAEAAPVETAALSSNTTGAVEDAERVAAAADAGAGNTQASDEDAASVEAAPPPPPAPLPGSDVLAIQLSRESWVEIYDRGGGRLYYSLAREGSEVVVQGAGPMRVLLGEVEGASVAYNGEHYDLSRYEGRSVVRFTVGELSGTSTDEPPAPAAAEEPLTFEQRPSTPPASTTTVADAGASSTTPVRNDPQPPAPQIARPDS